MSIKSIVESIVQALGRVHWKQTSPLREDDKRIIADMLKKDYFIILTRRSNHLSTYAIMLSNFLLSAKFGFYSHSLMNLEDEVNDPSDFRLIEAIGRGTTYSTFDDVFGTIDACALLKPKGLTLDEWTAIMDKMKSSLGTPYDSLFNLKDQNAMSCVELVRAALMTVPDYSTRFAAFEKMINRTKNLTPQMYYDCEDFEVVYSVKR